MLPFLFVSRDFLPLYVFHSKKKTFNRRNAQFMWIISQHTRTYTFSVVVAQNWKKKEERKLKIPISSPQVSCPLRRERGKESCCSPRFFFNAMRTNGCTDTAVCYLEEMNHFCSHTQFHFFFSSFLLFVFLVTRGTHKPPFFLFFFPSGFA